MADLQPTKSRLELLQAVADGAVSHHLPWRVARSSYSDWDRVDASPRWLRVTARVKEMALAGWIRHGQPVGPSAFASVLWELTDTGRAVLEANGGTP